MKSDKKNRNMEYWLVLSEKYFDALTTGEEEKALAQFLASDAANHPAFNEIKAVMGYLSTGKSIAKRNKPAKTRWTAGRTIQWSVAAASIALTIIIGTKLLPRPADTETAAESKETEYYYAYIDGKEYTDEDIVMQHMLTTMNKMSYTSTGSIEEQMGAMFRVNN